MSALVRGLAAGIAAGLLALAPAAHSAPGDEVVIDHVEAAGADGNLRLLVSVPDGADLEGLSVTVGGKQAESSAEFVAEGGTEVRRTTVLAIDTSDSMQQRGRFTAAKAAATQFLEDGVPDDVYVGIVTFDGEVKTALVPTLDRGAATDVIDGLELARGTLVYDGVVAAAELTGDAGQRSVLLLSDGANTNDTTLEATTTVLEESGVRVDAVALDQSGAARGALESMTLATDGVLVSADPAALADVFAAEAESLADQVQVTVELPASVTERQARVEVQLVSDGETISDAVVTLVQAEQEAAPTVGTRDEESGINLPRNAMFGGLAAIGVGLLVLFAVAFSMAGGTPRTVEQRIAAYGATAAATPSGNRKAEHPQSFNLDEMKGAAANVLHRNRGLEAKIEAKLEGAGSAFKAPEWILLHGAVMILGAMIGLLLGNGSFLLLLLGLIIGLVLPWMYLGFKRKRRVAAFNSGLADTLTLIAGSLQAGMSLAQGMDSVVEEGSEPIAGEFKRVLIETRLGVPLETALEGIAQRLASVDFAWVVMAIRIQREVGGNLAELLHTVASTLRERDYLRRQVKSLSAEGLLSAYILIALPIGLFIFLVAFRRSYIEPLYTEPVGVLLLAIAGALLGLGWLMMSRIVKVEV